MGRGKRPLFAPELKAEAVRLAKADDRSTGQRPGALTTPEREELQRLEMGMEREPKKSGGLLAKESKRGEPTRDLGTRRKAPISCVLMRT